MVIYFFFAGGSGTRSGNPPIMTLKFKMELISWLRYSYNTKPEFRKTYLPITILVDCINHVINFLNFRELDNTFKKSFDLPGMISVRVDSEEQTSSHLREYSL